MEKGSCLFNEPWVGPCKEPAIEGSLCCQKHSEEKCQVCGEQALTRCQASIGMMCGVPLCDVCEKGQMCLEHATSGPVMVVAALLGRGPVSSVFATRESLIAQNDKQKQIVERLEKRGAYPKLSTFEQFLKEG